VKIKIYLVQHIAMLESAHGDIEPPIYKIKTYRSQEENKWDIQRIINYKEIND